MNLLDQSKSTVFIALAFALGLAFADCIFISTDAASLKDLYGGCLTGACKPRNKPVFLDNDQSLLLNMARQPELMNLPYLKYLIGSPDNEKTQRGLSEKHYYWTDNLRQIKYELHQSEQLPGQITSSTFTMNLQNSGLTYEKLESIVGGNFQRFYNNNGMPCDRVSLAPFTHLSFSAAKNAFSLQEAEISYKGPPLAMPSAEDWQAAKDQHLAKTVNAHTAGNWQELQQQAGHRLNDNPQDASAHMWLAKSLGKQGRLNDALNEYEKAMALSGPQTTIYDQCLSDLREFKIIRDIPERREVELAHKGQHLRTGNVKRQRQEYLYDDSQNNNTGLAQSGNNLGM